MVANPLAVVRMNCLDPAQIRGLLRPQTRIVEPAPIEELGATIRVRSPCQSWKRIDEMSEFEQHVTRSASSCYPRQSIGRWCRSQRRVEEALAEGSIAIATSLPLSTEAPHEGGERSAPD